KGISNEEYIQAQLQMMESSQESSVVVAYEAAGTDVSIVYNGVLVISVEEDMTAEGKLKPGDRITGIDGKDIKEADDLMNYIKQKNAGDIVRIEFNREEKQMNTDIKLESFKDKELENKIGIGIRLVTDRSVQVEPEVN